MLWIPECPLLESNWRKLPKAPESHAMCHVPSRQSEKSNLICAHIILGKGIPIMQIVEHSEVSRASPAAIWALYADVENWPSWDPALEWVKWPGPFVAGGSGTMKPRGAPVSKFVMTRCEPNKGFTDVSPMPLARIVFDHVLEAVPGGTKVTHSATAHGPLGWLIALLIGPAIRRGMPPSVIAVAHQAALPGQT